MQHQQVDSQVQGTPFLTFIVPVYNIPIGMLSECIDSLLALGMQPDEREIIVVDDGSTESPIEQLHEQAQHIVYIRTENRGVAAARNTGMRMARGRYVQFVDGDDLLLKQSYEHVLRTARAEKCDMVMFDFTQKSVSNTSFTNESCVSGTELMQESNIHGSAWGYLFRRTLAENLQFTPGVAYGEDEEFTALLLLRAEKVCRTTAKAYYYRKRDSSAIHTPNRKRYVQRLDDNKQVIFRLSERLDSLTPDERLALQRRVAQLTMDYIYNIVHLTRDRSSLNERLEELRRHGLFPLPHRDYTTKYRWFRRFTNYETGRRLLLWLLPMIDKER